MSENYILDQQKAREIFQNIVPTLPISVKKIVSVSEVTDHGNANFIFKITLAAPKKFQTVYLKFAGPYNKRALSQGKKIAVEPVRLNGEVNMLRFLKKIWPSGTVPDVLFFNPRQHVVVLSSVGTPDQLLVNEFRYFRVHPEIGAVLGKLLGTLHGKTYGTKREYSASVGWKKHLLNLLVYQSWSLGLKKYVPAKKVDAFLSQANTYRSAVWADPVHRNIFVKSGRVSFVDFDHAMTYDPAFDVGIVLAHWLWMTQSGKKNIERGSQEFLQKFIQAYRLTFQRKSAQSDIVARQLLIRSYRWAGLYLVSRTDGASGSYFKAWPEWERKVRQFGIDLFINNLTNPAVKNITSFL